MEQAREGAEEQEKAVEVKVVVLQKDQVATASAQNAVKGYPINWEYPAITENVLQVRGLDMIDGTPVLDIKSWWECEKDVRKKCRLRKNNTVILKIIGTESLGVRGMCCLVQAGEQRIVIDPGVALGYLRHGLLPHPAQVAVGVNVRQVIIEALATATDIVFSHFHGDHVPMRDANPYQLSLQHMAALPEHIRCWCASWQDRSPKMQQRAMDLAVVLGNRMKIAEGCSTGILSFSPAQPHGLPQSRTGTVMMTRIKADGQVFVHGSDIQLLGDQAVDTILRWQPDTVFVSGPPIYRQSLSAPVLQQAWENSIRLAENVQTLIIDHHLLRSEQGLNWLDKLSQTAGKKIYCAADFMHRPRLMLEARRTELYKEMEVRENWHQEYEQGKISVGKDVISFRS